MKKLTLTLAAAGLLGMGTVAHAGNFDGFSLGAENQLKSTSASIVDDTGSFENLGGKHDIITVISGSYTFAVAPKFLLGIGATYDLGPTEVGRFGGGVDTLSIIEEKHYSIFVTPGYLVNDTTLLYAKIAYNSTNFNFSTEVESGSLKFSGVGFGAGIKVALTQNLHVYVETQRVNYSTNTDVGTFKPSSTIGSIGVSYKFQGWLSRHKTPSKQEEHNF